MTKPTATEIAEILRLHQLWRAGDVAGRRANLIGANLYGADLYGADLGDWERDPATGYALRLDSEAAE